MIVWKPSLGHTLIVTGMSMFFGMFMTGVASLVFYSMDLFLSQEAGLDLWALFSILLWLFLICIPEESEL